MYDMYYVRWYLVVFISVVYKYVRYVTTYLYI